MSRRDFWNVPSVWCFLTMLAGLLGAMAVTAIL